MREKIMPGNQGKDCPHNGEGKKHCACDECDWFLCCFPEYGKYEGCENCDDGYCPRNQKSFIRKFLDKLSKTT